MPTEKQFKELIKKCNWTYTTRNGQYGYVIKSKKNGNSIFLPETCSMFLQEIDCGFRGTYSLYWSANIFKKMDDSAHILQFSPDGKSVSFTPRMTGCVIRPIINKKK